MGVRQSKAWLTWAGFVLVALLAAFAAPATAQERRIALVVGNGDYSEVGDLPNSVNDARLIRATLQKIGFEVVYRENVDKRSMERAIGEFANKLYDAGSNAVALVYYAGHGVQSNGENFLLPTDIPLRRETDLRLNALRADDVVYQMVGAKSRVNIVILDACRDNPFEMTVRAIMRGGGLADMQLGSEFFVAYAATAGNVAWDGDGDSKNSPYAMAVARYLSMADTEISEIFRLIRNEVAEVTKGRQLPETRTTLRNQFYFTRSGKPMPPMAATPPAVGPPPTMASVAAIEPSTLYGKWCEVSRGNNFYMQVTSTRLTYYVEGASQRYNVREVKAAADGSLQVTWTNGGQTMLTEFGEFGEDGRSMTQVRGRAGAEDWRTYNRRYRKC